MAEINFLGGVVLLSSYNMRDSLFLYILHFLCLNESLNIKLKQTHTA